MSTLLTASLVASLVGALALAAFGLRRWRRHGFRFSLRTSLVALTLASLMLAAFMQWVWPRLLHVRALYQIRAGGGEVYLPDPEAITPGRDEWDGTPSLAWGGGVSDIWFDSDAEVAAALPSLPALTQLKAICLGRSTTNASLRNLAAVIPNAKLLGLQLQSSQITDFAPLKNLAALPDIFSNTVALTDQGLQALPEIRGLERLFILEEGKQARPARFGPQGFGAIARVPELKYLTLSNLEITSESAAHLRGAKKLRELTLHRCLIDAGDVAALREALPNCQIKFNERQLP
jgi:hypothetical protein